MHPFFKISPLKRLLSYVVPVSIANSSSAQNPFLEFILYRNQWQLATEEALYSDGNRYQPFRLAFKKVKADKLAKTANCLVLGTGLGSVVEILHDRYNCKANFTLVEYDDKILAWALEHLSAKGIKNLKPQCANAQTFVAANKGKYDLICIDIFNGREVPTVFTEKEFLQNTKRLMAPNGLWIMNYIINDRTEMVEYMRNIKEVFPTVQMLEKDQNRILIFG